MGRTHPTECPHGRIIDSGSFDFEPEGCYECRAAAAQYAADAAEAQPLRERVKELETKLDRYEQLLATAYQLAGLAGAPQRFLDAYALHDDVDPNSLLPVTLDELDEYKGRRHE